MRAAAFVATTILWVAGYGAAPAESRSDVAADGRTIAVAQCGACHGLDQALKSPRADAPPFRILQRRYSFPVLAEELMEGVKLGHPDMPRFQFPPRAVDALIAYLRSIQAHDRSSRGKRS